MAALSLSLSAAGDAITAAAGDALSASATAASSAASALPPGVSAGVGAGAVITVGDGDGAHLLNASAGRASEQQLSKAAWAAAARILGDAPPLKSKSKSKSKGKSGVDMAAASSQPVYMAKAASTAAAAVASSSARSSRLSRFLGDDADDATVTTAAPLLTPQWLLQPYHTTRMQLL
jgi:hypothetical protein